MQKENRYNTRLQKLKHPRYNSEVCYNLKGPTLVILHPNEAQEGVFSLESLNIPDPSQQLQSFCKNIKKIVQ